MMKAFAHVMKSRLKHKQNKTKEDQYFEQTISTSYDISSKEYITPLVNLLKGGQMNSVLRALLLLLTVCHFLH